MKILDDSREKAIEILEGLHIDVEDLTDELRFDYQHSSQYPSNPNAFSRANNTGDWVMSCCPNHPESRPSFGISVEPPYHCNCFLCGYLGTVDVVIEIAFGLNEGEGLRMLLSSFMLDEQRSELDIEGIIASGREPIRIPHLDEKVLQDLMESRKANEWEYEKRLAYMRQRGFSQRTLDTYEIAVDIANECIVFPQRTRTGLLRFLQKRKIGDDYRGAKFINEGSPVKKDILFGLHFIDRLKNTPQRIRRVRVVESPTDAMSNYEVGFAAVALNGKLLFKNQIQELQMAGVEVVDLMLDNDKWGIQGGDAAARKLDKAGFVVNRVVYPSHFYKDANALLKADLLHKCDIENINLIGGI